MSLSEPERIEADRHFRWRGGQVSRIEGISDGVFALAVALLAFAQRAPATYADLLQTFRELPAFVLSSTFLFWCWYLHFKVFRRYGAQDVLTVVINSALLVLLLFFVYPLRFLANFLITGPLFYGGVGRGPVGGEVVFLGQGTGLMVFYSAAFVALFGCFAALNLSGYRHRDRLGLSARERFLARADVRLHLISVAVGGLALVMALLGQPIAAGLSFFLMGPAHGFHGWWTGSRLERLAAR